MAGRQIYSESEKFCLQELIIKYKLNSKATIAAGNPSLKKMAWARLTEEFNSIETNTKRTESQLKKLWDNLKTRQKQTLNLEKRARMRTGGGQYEPPPSTSGETSQDTLSAALLESTDVEMRFVIDSDAVEAEDNDVNVTHDETQPGPSQDRTGSRTTNRGYNSRLSDYDTGTIQPSGARNVRAQVIQEEFSLRQRSYQRAQEREEELHALKITEREWLVKLSEEKFNTACIERQCAEEQLLCMKANREAAEINLKKLKE